MLFFVAGEGLKKSVLKYATFSDENAMLSRLIHAALLPGPIDGLLLSKT